MTDNVIKLSSRRDAEAEAESIESQQRWLELGAWVRRLNTSFRERDIIGVAKAMDEAMYISDEIVLHAEDF